MKQSTPFAVALAALCLAGCERSEGEVRTDRPFVNDAAEPGRDGLGQPVEVDAEDRDRAEQGGRNVAAGPNAQGTVAPTPDPDPSLVDRARETRQEFIAAARRRLDQVERDLELADQRSRERGVAVRTEAREEKQRLEADLERLGQATEEAWHDTRAGFADALDRLEAQAKRLRNEIDPDA